MAKQNTKAAPHKAADKPKQSEPIAASAEQSADLAPDQTQTGQEPNGNDAPEQVPTPTEPADPIDAANADATSEQTLTGQGAEGNEAPVPTDPSPAEPAPIGTKAAPAKSTTRGKTAKTVRETAAQSVARQVFKSHPDKRTVYVTSDGTPFFVKCDADNHARTLNDPAVTTITNENHKA